MITIGLICMITILLMSGAAFAPLALVAMVILIPLLPIIGMLVPLVMGLLAPVGI